MTRPIMPADDTPTGITPATVGEKLSALLDGELPAGELEHLVAHVGTSAEHRGRLARYGLISSTLRGAGCARIETAERVTVLVVHDLAHRVRRMLDADPEPGVAAPITGRPAPAGRRWIPLAAAAAVAAVAVLLVPRHLAQLPAVDHAPGPARVAQAGRASSGLVSAALPMAPRRVPAELIAASDRAAISPQRIASYLVYHGEFSGLLAAKLTDSHIVTRRTYAVDASPPDPVTP